MNDTEISFIGQDLDKIYMNFMENIQDSASEKVKASYLILHDAFDTYMNAIQEDIFHQGYVLGYIQGFADKKKDTI